MTERFNSGESSFIFGINFQQNQLLVGWSFESMLGSRRRSEKEISVLHWRFRNNCFISELLKDIQDAISLILHYRTMWWFSADSSDIFTTLDVRLIFILSSTNRLISGGQNSSKKQTVCFLLLDPRDKEHKDTEQIDLNVPRRGQYLHNAWKEHQDAVYWVDIDLAIRKGLTFYQDSIECNHLSRNTSSLLYSKSSQIEDWRSLTWESNTCHLDHHQRSRYVTIGLEVKFQWVLQLINNQKEKLFDSHKKKLPDEQNSSSQPNQSQSQSVIDQGNLITRKMCLLLKVKRPVLKRSVWNLFTKKLCSSDWSGQLDITQNVIGVQTCPSGENKNVRVEQTHDRSGKLDKHNVAAQDNPEVYREIKMLNIDNDLIRERIEENMDFKIPGLPHSTVKQLHGASVRELIQKIKYHPNRHARQRDLQQNQSFNPFSQESKQMIHEVGNIELCELLEMEPKAQCKVCLSYCDIGIVYCTCGHLLRKGTEENKKFIQYTMDLLSIPDYYIKKGRPHGHRYGKKPGDREYYIAHQFKKKCKNKYYQDIHDRFVRDDKFRSRMIEIDRTEDICRQMDDLADEDHTHHLTPQEVDTYRSNLVDSFKQD